MNLVDYQTTLKSLKFGGDRPGGGSSNEPYIQNPTQTSPPNLPLLGSLGFPMSKASAMDVERLTKFFADGTKGIQFTAKQNLLLKTAVRTEASIGVVNQGVYLPSNTILQAGIAGAGGHVNYIGIDPTKGPLKYSTVVKAKNKAPDSEILKVLTEESTTNRLLFLTKKHIYKSTGLNSIFQTPDTVLQRYEGGPGSTLGIGYTDINLTPERSPRGNKLDDTSTDLPYATMTMEELGEQPTFRGTNTIQDFRKILRKNPRINQDLITDAPDYNEYGLSKRVNLGDPGRVGRQIRSYTLGNGAVDTINSLQLYKSERLESKFGDINDLVKFRIAVIDNEDPVKNTYIHFRAFLNGVQDQYTREEVQHRFNGRAEDFGTYLNFSRGINLSWTVAAQSKEELIPMYQKLNYLASTLAPDYSSKGYMRGVLVSLTIGGYLYEQVGKIISMTLELPEDATWEIGIRDSLTSKTAEGISDSSVKELPHLVRVSNVAFVPIHKFAPQLQKNEWNSDGSVKSFGKQRYIALADGNGPARNNYDS